MILTDKCLKAFEKWIGRHERYVVETICSYEGYYGKNEFEVTVQDCFENMPETLQYAIIQEFFDSVGVYINVYPEYDKMSDYNRGYDYQITLEGEKTSVNSSLPDCTETRNEALKAAILTCNDIYNGRD